MSVWLDIFISIHQTINVLSITIMCNVVYGFFCVTKHTVIWGLTLCCVVDLESCLLSCPGSSVGRVLCLVSRVSWVRVPPRAAPFEKDFVVVHLPSYATFIYIYTYLLMSVTVMGDGYRRCFVRIPTPQKKWWMPKCNDSVMIP